MHLYLWVWGTRWPHMIDRSQVDITRKPAGLVLYSQRETEQSWHPPEIRIHLHLQITAHPLQKMHSPICLALRKCHSMKECKVSTLHASVIEKNGWISHPQKDFLYLTVNKTDLLSNSKERTLKPQDWHLCLGSTQVIVSDKEKAGPSRKGINSWHWSNPQQRLHPYNGIFLMREQLRRLLGKEWQIGQSLCRLTNRYRPTLNISWPLWATKLCVHELWKKAPPPPPPTRQTISFVQTRCTRSTFIGPIQPKGAF